MPPQARGKRAPRPAPPPERAFRRYDVVLVGDEGPRLEQLATAQTRTVHQQLAHLVRQALAAWDQEHGSARSAHDGHR